MKPKVLAFWLFALLLPVLLVLALEGMLRLGGIGAASRAPFIPVPGQPDYQALNPDYAKRYFTGFEPGVAFTPFRTVKPEETVRVVVLGGSSVAGFPYQFYHGFPSRLALKLGRALGRPVEVINLGLTAVNSYTLWDLREAVAAQDPDAVLIYAGHNEYYGAFGVGSAIYDVGNRVWMKRLALRLKHTAVFTLLERLLQGPASPPAGEQTLMARVVHDASITLDGETYQAGLAQFATNLQEVLDTFAEAGIPVYVGTLTSNLKDQPPLGDAPEAWAAFDRGQDLLAAGDTAAAYTSFLAAKEYDDIRFRAPEAINIMLRRAARAPGITLVDVEAAFRSQSPGSIPGASLFDDHLHPNARGYDLIADQFAESLLAKEGRTPFQSVAPPTDVRVDPLDQAHADLQIARLTGGYPFDKTVAREDEERRYSALLRRAISEGPYPDSLAARVLAHQITVPEALLQAVHHARSRQDTLAAILHYRSLMYWQPFNDRLMQQALDYALAQPTYPATAELARVAAHYSSDLYVLNALAAVELHQGHLAEAARLLDVVERRDPTSSVMLYNQARLRVLRGDTLEARAYFTRYRQAR